MLAGAVENMTCDTSFDKKRWPDAIILHTTKASEGRGSWKTRRILFKGNARAPQPSSPPLPNLNAKMKASGCDATYPRFPRTHGAASTVQFPGCGYGCGHGYSYGRWCGQRYGLIRVVVKTMGITMATAVVRQSGLAWSPRTLERARVGANGLQRAIPNYATDEASE